MRFIGPSAKNALKHAVAPFTRLLYGGIGSVFMFHRVMPRPCHPRVGWAHELDVTPDFLAECVDLVRERGIAIVSIDELVEILRAPSRSRGRVAVLTFDDGYADNATLVPSVLGALDAPFCVYVATGFVDRTILPWWYVLEEVLAMGHPIALSGVSGAAPTVATHPQAREDLFMAIAQRFEGLDDRGGEIALARSLFGDDKVDRALSQTAMRWEDVVALAADPCVTIGAHTKSHRRLARLDRETAFDEMKGSRDILEARLGHPVRHFAYPYGTAHEAGPREFALAREAGFVSAVTTRRANLFRAHREHLTSLPRIRGTTRAEIELQLSGADPALTNRGRIVVTA